MPRYSRALVWFRRDLRTHDHAALAAALNEADQVWCVFVFDRAILDALEERRDRRVEFIHGSVVELDQRLRQRGGALRVLHADAREAVPRLADALGVDAVYANRDYEPAAIARDAAVERALTAAGRVLHAFKDQVVFERDEVVTAAGLPFSVFTPYRRAWLRALAPEHLAERVAPGRASALAPPDVADGGVPALQALGFEPTNLRALGIAPGMSGGVRRFADFRERIDDYARARDYPAIKGPSYLSMDLRFGTVSIREVAGFAHARSLHPGGEGAATWLSELVWREFYAQLLWHHPRVVDHAFRSEYDALAFRNDAEQFARWREGATGYPIVDAAMRQLNSTGYMHNRLRMIAASFLVKDLLVDWRWGERYFAARLNDYELASNNGGWQWAASTGCDAQPYFRVFNPVTQSRRFDGEGAFIRRYVPELAAYSSAEIHAPWLLPAHVQAQRNAVIGHDYPLPIVEHEAARREALAMYGAVKAQRV